MSTMDNHPDLEQAFGQIQDYLDGVLSQDEERTFEALMSASPALQAEVQGWRVFMSRLDEVPRMQPSPQFRERILESLPAAAAGSALGVAGAHPPAERLQDFVEGVLPQAVAARIRVHVDACEPCRTDVAEWQELFSALGTLPGLAPAAGFTDRVMDAVQTAPALAARVAAPPAPVRPSFPERLAARVRMLVPSGARGRAVAAALLAMPTAAAGLVLWFVLAHPLLTPGHLLSFGLWRVNDLAGSALAWMGSALLESGVTLTLLEAAQRLVSAPALALGGAVAFCATVLGSIWVLHRFLLAPPVEGPNAHAHG